MEVVSASGEVIDPYFCRLVERRAALRIRQRPGSGNALGGVKFIFPNNFDVYLHDTNATTLFDRIERGLSHGCVRVEEPHKLAQYVLRDQPEWTPEAIDAAMKSGQEKHVKLTTPIPVYIVYKTAWVHDGGVRFLKDLYGHDADQAARLFPASVTRRGDPWPGNAPLRLRSSAASPPVRSRSRARTGSATDRFRARSLTYPYDEGAIFAMPGEKIPLAVTAPATRLHSIDAPQGGLVATGPNKWTWEAPVKPGLYALKVKTPAGDTLADFSAFVMVPSKAVTKGVLNRYEIGEYPETPLKGNPIYIPPKGFIEVTRQNEDTKVSPNFRIKEFLDQAEERLSEISRARRAAGVLTGGDRRALETAGWDAGDIFVMSGYRTPYYNKQLDDTKYSLHQWGRASDIFLDKDDNGRMDDFNKDKVDFEGGCGRARRSPGSARQDARARSFIGGIGIYGSTSAHGPFVHVDTRPWRARW